jgi:hypothetical protein
LNNINQELLIKSMRPLSCFHKQAE